MTFDYSRIRDNTAEPLIRRFGKAGHLSVNVPATGAPYDSQIGDETLHEVQLVQTLFTSDNNNGTLVEETDVLFLVSTEGVTVDPEMAQRVIANGDTYQVIRVDPLQPGPTVLLWKVHARK